MNTVIETVAYLHIKNKKILLVLAKGKQAYLLPGGKKNEHESDIEALIREIKEELSVDLIPESLKSYGVFEAQAHGKPEGIIVRTMCFFGKHRGEFQPNNEIVDFRFFTQQEYAEMADTAPLGHVLNKHLKENGLID